MSETTLGTYRILFEQKRAFYICKTIVIFSGPIFKKHNVKDARSVSLYSYNWSQIMQYVKYTKLINIAKGFAKFCDK